MAAYKTWGKPNKKPLIAISGFGMSVEDWHDLGYATLLTNDFYLVAVNPFESQTKQSDLTLDSSTKYIESVLDELNIHSAVVWGYSLGAKVALHFASKNVSKVEGLAVGGFELKSEVIYHDDLVINTLKLGAGEWTKLWQSMFSMPKEMVLRFSRSDTSQLIKLRCAEAKWQSLEKVLLEIQAINSIAYAAEDCFFKVQTREACSLIEHCQFIEIPNCNHFEVMTQTKKVSQMIIQHFA